MIGFARSVVERVAVESFSCTPEMSRAIERGHLERAGISVVVNFARAHPETWNRLFDRMIVQPGYRHIATGSDQIVVTDGQGAIKIDRASRYMSAAERALRSQQRHFLYEAANRYLSDFLLPQSVNLEQAPLRERPNAVLTRQPLVDIRVGDMIHQNGDTLSRSLAKTGISSVKVADQLHGFCDSSEDMLDAEGLWPDVGGAGNIVVAGNGQVVLVDSYPTDGSHRERKSLVPGCQTIQEEHEVIMRHLDTLATDILPKHSLAWPIR